MAKVRTDQSVMSANTPARSQLSEERANRSTEMHRGMVFRIYYTDDPKNVTKNSQNPQVTYDVILISGPMEGQIIPNVRSASSLGGQYNYSETVLRKASKPFSGPGAVPLCKQDGDIVFIEFTNGLLSAPVIVGSGAHPLDKANTGAKKADGPYMVSEYNGVKTLIDKNGVFTLTRKGGQFDATQDFFIPAAGGNEAQLKLEKEKLSTSAKEVSIALDGTAKKISMVTPGGVTITVDGEGKKVTITAKGGSGEVEIDGASGKISLKGDLVDIGAAASSLCLLGTEFLAWATSHVHTSGGPGSPTSPPIAPPPASTLSGTVKVQS